jgi:4-amino-4-deoxy-L-arabinose transferase-like glycosyltransferase
MSRRDLGLLAVVFLIACGARLGALAFRGPSTPLEGDAVEYDEVAGNLIAGHGFALDGVPSARRMPGWPILLAAWYEVVGRSPATGKVLSCLLGAAAAFFLGLAGHRLGGRGAGIVAALGAALYPPMVIYATEPLTESATLFWYAVALWLMLEARQRTSWTYLAACGAAFGAAILTRGTSVALLGGACLALLLAETPFRRRTAGGAVLVGVAAVAVVTPWVVRNAVVMGIPTLSTQSQTQLWQGAHVGATGRNRTDWPPTNRRYSELGSKEISASAQMGAEAKAFIREHPGTYARLSVVKAWELWKPWSDGLGIVPNLVYSLAAVPLILLAGAGAFTGGATRFDRLLVTFSVVLFTLLHMIWSAIVRYRVPIDTLLILYAALWIANRIVPPDERAPQLGRDSHEVRVG